MVSNIVVLGFDNQYGAEAMLEDLHKWEKDDLIDVEDAVIASAGSGGQIEIHQTHRSEVGKFTLRGSGVGLVAGALLGGPVLGLVAGATYGVFKGKRRDKAFGLDDHFVQSVSGWVRPEQSALFLLVKHGNAEQLQVKLKPYAAKVLSTSLAPEQEELLRQTLDEEVYDTE